METPRPRDSHSRSNNAFTSFANAPISISYIGQSLLPVPPLRGIIPPARGSTREDTGRTPIRSLNHSPTSGRGTHYPSMTHLITTSRLSQRPRPTPYLETRGFYQRNGSTLMARIPKVTRDWAPPWCTSQHAPHIHRRRMERRDPHHHACGTGGNSHCPNHLRGPLMDRSLHRLPL